MKVAVNIFTIVWGIYTLMWFVIGALSLHRLKRARSLLNDAQKDLDIMSSILEKFKRVEMPLDASIIETYMKLFDAAEQSFTAKMELCNKTRSK